MPRLSALCAVAVLAGCARGEEAPAALTVASLRQPAASLYHLGLDAGCFEQERLAVADRPFDVGRDALPLLLDGRADVAIAYATPTLRAALSDPRLRVLSKLHSSARNTRLVARAQAGIRSFSDLRGKRLGLLRGTSADFFAEVAVTAGGIPRGSAVLVDVAPAAAPEALARGELDAAVLWDPHAARAEELLGAAGRTLVTDLYVETSLLVTRADLLAAKEPALRALLRGLRCAERHVRDHPDQARALVIRRFAEQTPAAIDAQLGRVTRGLGLDNALLDVLGRERDWLVATTRGAGAPDLTAVVDGRLLDEVYPESVTLLPGRPGLRW